VTFAFSTSFPTKAGHTSELVAILVASNPALADAGCLRYDVGVDQAEPFMVHVHELWTSREAHDDSLKLDSTRAAIARALPALAGAPIPGTTFEVLGSPLS
jgi:quinol monooxygenase YgiN